MSARIAVASLWMTTYGGCHLDTATATTERSSVAGGVQHRILVVQLGANANEAKANRAHAAPLVDNRSAVDVGFLRRGTVSIPVQKPQFSEAFPGAIISQGTDESTLRAEEVGMQLAFIDTKHIELERYRPPFIDADWHASCQAIDKGIEGKEWEELYCYCRDLSQAAGAKKPSESQNAKALWAVKAARDREEEFS